MGWDDDSATAAEGGWVPPHMRPAQVLASRAAEAAEERERLRREDEQRALAEAKLRRWQVDAHAYEAATGYTLEQVRQGWAAAAEAREAAGIPDRDPASEYGTRDRPAVLIGGDEVRPRIPDDQARRAEETGAFYIGAQDRLSDRSGRFEAMRADYHRRLAERKAAAADREREIRRAEIDDLVELHRAECLALDPAEYVPHALGSHPARRARMASDSITRVCAGPATIIG